MKIKKIRKIVMISIIGFMLVVSSKSLAATKMEINGGTAWTDINISDSYDRCLELNDTTSTLGTNGLQAHLSTEYDYSAMAVFSASSYGTATTDNLGDNSTTSNNSGIYGINNKYWRQTSGILNNATSTSTEYIYGLYNENGTTKKYVNRFDIQGNEYTSDGKAKNGKRTVSFTVDTDGNDGTRGWLGSVHAVGGATGMSICVKYGLFGGAIGDRFGVPLNDETSGGNYGRVTFRPVLWN